MLSIPPLLRQAVIADRKRCLDMKDLVPHPDFPLFEETMIYLIHLTQLYLPKRILDAGSGVTSVLLRKYNPTAHVVSVDADEKWLQNTHELLRRFDLTSGLLLPWPIFLRDRATYEGTFDLICHDLGNMDFRLKTLPTVLRMLAPTGAVLLDNLGVPSYKEFAIALMAYHGFTPLYPPEPETLDASGAGRFGAFIRTL